MEICVVAMNKLYSIIGILTYFLSVVASTLDKEGNYPLSPIYVYLFLGASVIYSFIVLFNLWESKKILTIIFFIVTVLSVCYSIYITFINLFPNKAILIIGNISNAIRAFMIWFTIVIFWRKNSKGS